MRWRLGDVERVKRARQDIELLAVVFLLRAEIIAWMSLSILN